MIRRSRFRKRPVVAAFVAVTVIVLGLCGFYATVPVTPSDTARYRGLQSVEACLNLGSTMLT